MDAFPNINRFEEYLSKAKDWGVFKHILSIPVMLRHPRFFWREYAALPIRDKAVQFITYGAIFALFIWLMAYESPSIGELVRIITLEIAALLPYVVILSLSNMIVRWEWKGLWFFVVFCCYTKFICLIPQLIALRMYFETEASVLIGVAAFIPVITELLVMVYPAYIWQTTKSKVLWAIVLTVLLLNVYDSFFIFSGMPRPSNSNYENKIVKERFELGQSIKNAYDIPSFVVTSEKSKEVRYLYSNPTDSIASFKFNDTDRFFVDLAQDIDTLKAICGRTHFRTNKSFFTQMYQLKQGIQYVHETKKYEESPIVKQRAVMLDSVIVDRIYYREYNKELEEMNIKLFSQEIKEAEQYSMAFSTNYLGALWHPVLFINRYYANKASF